MVPLILLSLLSVSFGLPLTIVNNATENASDLGTSLQIPNSKNQTLQALKDSLGKYVQNVEGAIQEIQDDSAVFLENLEHEKINQLLQLFDTSPCVGVNEFDHLKKEFRIELGLLEVPVRETIGEIKDKFNEVKTSFDIEQSLLGVKRISCQLINTTHCAPEVEADSPCLNGLCSKTVVLLHNISTANNTGMFAPGNTKPERNLMSTECPDGGFRCSDGQCIVFSYACDNQYDCNDKSDEISGCTTPCSGKRCRNLNCISEDKICDGVDDCGDGTDENNCIRHNEGNCSLLTGKFLCPNKVVCLAVSSMCNGKNDCNDGSDEGNGCTNTTGCKNCATIGGACLRTPSGPLCLRKCPHNFVLDLSSGVCISAHRNPDPIVTYKSMSFINMSDKLNILTKRFLNGYILLKKHMYELMKDTVLNLDKCMQRHHNSNNSLHNPLLVI